jgi:hypothetical protein
MVRRMTVVAACLACALPIVLLAQAEDFEGEFDLDKGKYRNIKKIALVDISGQAKQSKDHTGPWTDDGLKLVAEAFRKSGRDVVVGADVANAFQQIAPLPTSADIQAALVKRKIKPAEAAQAAKFLENSWKDREPGDAARLGYAFYRPDGSVNLERPIFNIKDEKTKNADDDEVERRMAVLASKLGVDAIARLEFGFGSWRYSEPAWQTIAKNSGKAVGIVPSIKNIIALFRGEQAQVFIALTVFDSQGKKRIVDVAGGCKSKEGTGLSVKTGSKLEQYTPGTTAGCVDNVFARMAKD